MSHMHLRLFSAIAVLAFAHPGKAATIVSNYSQPTDGLIGLTTGDYYGFAFVTGSSPTGYTLNSITIAEYVTSASSPLLHAAIYESSSFLPDWNSATHLQQTASATGSDVPVSYEPTTTLTLAPNTKYWIVVTGSPDEGNSFFATASQSYTTTDGWSIPLELAYSPDGSYWEVNPYVARFSVDAVAAVPEPSACALGGLGFAALLLGRRRARR